MNQTGKTTDTRYEDKALLSVKEMCVYLSIGQTKCRELLADPANGFTVRIGNRLYAHKAHLDKWLENRIY
jgi:excisionase family DNA binding protein